jgi:hypothetical protein
MQLERRQWLKVSGQALVLALFGPLDAYAMRKGRIDTSRIGTARIDYAERPVREFLKMHFAGSRTFSARGMDNKERFLTRRFRLGLYKYFGRAAKSDKAPPMVTDPFTGSQGAATFAVGDAKVRSEKAWVPVAFSDGQINWTITYLLRNDQERNDDRWRIDDIQDVRGMLLSEVLKKL